MFVSGAGDYMLLVSAIFSWPTIEVSLRRESEYANGFLCLSRWAAERW